MSPRCASWTCIRTRFSHSFSLPRCQEPEFWTSANRDHPSWSVAFPAPSKDSRSLPLEYCQGKSLSQRKLSPFFTFCLSSWLFPENNFVAPGAVEPARRCPSTACFQCVDHDPTPTLLTCSFLLTITTVPFHLCLNAIAGSSYSTCKLFSTYSARYFPFPGLLRLGRNPCPIERGNSDNFDQCEGYTYEKVITVHE
jgi:hypothetical protein